MRRNCFFQRYFAMMCMNDGLTEREPKSEASAAVANRISPAKNISKHAPLVRPGYQGRYR